MIRSLAILLTITAQSAFLSAEPPTSAPTTTPTTPASPTPAQLAFFESKVRPILVDQCYQCHSRQAKKVRGHLLLDSREGWLKGGDSGDVIIPGQPAKSLLVKAVQYSDDDTAMPPKQKLPQEQIDALVQWVKMGAPDPRTNPDAPPLATRVDLEKARHHWAYQPLSNPTPPAVKDSAWPRNDIDRFLLSKLEAKGLQPAADAPDTVIVRRLYFDLVGLPPTPDEIDAYIKNTSPSKSQDLVDGLLASPQYGQRWGRHWLDVARYAESLTLRGLILKDAWRYRDYVIDTFNNDRPFDRFMIEQIAGDLLPASNIDQQRQQITATAFLAIGNYNLEEQNKKQLEMDIVDEQIETIGRAFLAQTIGCARCHDHKFDPIPTLDYYALAGILHSTQTVEHANVSKWLEIPLPVDPGRDQIFAAHDAAVASLKSKIAHAKSLADASHNTKSAKDSILPLSALSGLVVDDTQAKRVGQWRHSSAAKSYIGDGYLVDDSDHSESRTLTFLPDISHAGKYEVRFAYTAHPDRAASVSVTVFSADGEKTMTVNEKEDPPLDGHFVSLGQYTFEKNGQGFVIVSNENAKGIITADAVQFLPAEMLDAAPVSSTVASTATTAPATQASTTQPSTHPTTASAQDNLKRLESELKKLIDTGPQRDAVVSVRESKTIGDTRVHVRGSVQTLADPAPRGFLRVVPVKNPPLIPANQSGRLQLGQWLASPENPLPPRVMANRAWLWLMGQGIVRTPDNFGTTGQSPTDPQLLDFLASRLLEDHWSMKKLIRQIVLSHAYQQSSTPPTSALEADPENRLWGRMNRRRLDAECIRDAILFTSGQLSPDTGGQTYKTPLASDFGFKQTDTRRSVYLPVFRNALPEIFDAFDFADPSVSTSQRNVSTVAPQALFMLNNPFVLDQSRHAATRLAAEKSDCDALQRIEWAYRQTLGRIPTDPERALALHFLKTSSTDDKIGDIEAWSQLFHALFASMDFRYGD